MVLVPHLVLSVWHIFELKMNTCGLCRLGKKFQDILKSGQKIKSSGGSQRIGVLVVGCSQIKKVKNQAPFIFILDYFSVSYLSTHVY